MSVAQRIAVQPPQAHHTNCQKANDLAHAAVGRNSGVGRSYLRRLPQISRDPTVFLKPQGAVDIESHLGSLKDANPIPYITRLLQGVPGHICANSLATRFRHGRHEIDARRACRQESVMCLVLQESKNRRALLRAGL